MTQPTLGSLFNAPPIDMKRKPVSEPVRLAASAQRVLTALRGAHDTPHMYPGGWVPNRVLVLPDIGGQRAVGRIDELRTAGHNIEKRHVKGGTWTYRLVETSK